MQREVIGVATDVTTDSPSMAATEQLPNSHAVQTSAQDPGKQRCGLEVAAGPTELHSGARAAAALNAAPTAGGRIGVPTLSEASAPRATPVPDAAAEAAATPSSAAGAAISPDFSAAPDAVAPGPALDAAAVACGASTSEATREPGAAAARAAVPHLAATQAAAAPNAAVATTSAEAAPVTAAAEGNAAPSTSGAMQPNAAPAADSEAPAADAVPASADAKPSRARKPRAAKAGPSTSSQAARSRARKEWAVESADVVVTNGQEAQKDAGKRKRGGPRKGAAKEEGEGAAASAPAPKRRRTKQPPPPQQAAEAEAGAANMDGPRQASSGGDAGGSAGGAPGGAGDAGGAVPARRPSRARRAPAASKVSEGEAAEHQEGGSGGGSDAAPAAKRRRAAAERRPPPRQRRQGPPLTLEEKHPLRSFGHALRRVQAQLQRITQEEHLINVYAADGWKGASREKVRLTHDLERAQQKVAQCKEMMRQAVKFCEDSLGDKPIPAEKFDSDGELDQSAIFCSRCRGCESQDDNDIILCDGPCNRAYHEKCLNPPLVAADLPEDDGWLCPGCDTKVDIVNQINEYFSTDYAIDTPWQDLFAEPPEEQERMQLRRLRSSDADAHPPGAAALGADGGLGAASLLHAELPSDDEDDESYSEGNSGTDVGSAGGDAGAIERSAGSVSGDDSGDEMGDTGSGGVSSGSGGGSVDDEEMQDLSGGGSSSGGSGVDSGDSGAGPSRPRRKRRAAAAAAIAAGFGQGGGRQGPPKGEDRKDGGIRDNSDGDCKSGSSSGGTGGAVEEAEAQDTLVARGRRRRAPVDYRALHEQLFGPNAGDEAVGEDSEDEDFKLVPDGC